MVEAAFNFLVTMMMIFWA